MQAFTINMELAMLVPPKSPLTGSYFWMWALYDLRIGKSTDTMAHCQIASNDVIQMNPHQLDAVFLTGIPDVRSSLPQA